MAAQGHLGWTLPEKLGGQGQNWVSYGLLHEEIGRACSSARSLLTVHSMTAHALLRWGSARQSQAWLPALATGQKLAAFALTEENAGSDAGAVESTAEPVSHGYRLNGRKKWITFGQIADVFLLFARLEDRIAAFLVESDRPGLLCEPIRDMLGLRASLLAEATLTNCFVPEESLLGKSRLSPVAQTALDVGRCSVAWGSVGIAQACLEWSLARAQSRRQFGALLKDRQLIQQMIANMVVNVQAARLLCLSAARLRDAGDPLSASETMKAKYFAAAAAMKAAADAVQIHGARGCEPDHPAQRCFRDAKIMEIIEGSSQIHQIAIAEQAFAEARPLDGS